MSNVFDQLCNHPLYSIWEKGKLINADFEVHKLEKVLKDIFNNCYVNNSGKTIGDEVESSFFLSWGLRNKVHHSIESLEILQRYFKDIIRKQMMFFIDFASKI